MRIATIATIVTFLPSILPPSRAAGPVAWGACLVSARWTARGGLASGPCGAPRLLLPELHAAELPRLRMRQRRDERDLTGILVGREDLLDVVLQLAHQLGRGSESRTHADERLRSDAAGRVRRRHHR